MPSKNSKKVICHDIDGKTYEFDSSELRFRPSVYGILIKDNKILLSPQWDGYDFPGGGMELHETVHEGLVREFLEETGFTVQPQQLIACESSFFYPKYSKLSTQPANTVLIYYTVTLVKGRLSTDGFDETEKAYAKIAEWIDLDKIEALKFLNPVDSVAIIHKALTLTKASA
ncbi:MAG: hypothetical protein A3B30_03175 [Candidatus Komeilibacteria bacterium RIFCSPLOWO2_01_FULL_52_15]|uniref:Nudix hydrolase domain-containing protein n=2 Tax=Candidatus Komeiliibacteriota TaxID=1817908 RepID=A0A1G2BMU4_9BACT|nr:MAG: hypothetical protein A2677_03610 [Candidatus Komeilibacteria bacterium RIFCSPHIGHO2_01_FULL_52_14]OGY90453.1 MAG: hypothetical protein A3B30_03175 [Candidatus Komeilibacteria bacterium RIFCSPLOWO2_01_FULL_52_15]